MNEVTLPSFVRYPPVTLKIVPNACYKCTLEKIDQWEQRKSGTEILMRLSEQLLELVSAFKEARKNFKLIFLLN